MKKFFLFIPLVLLLGVYSCNSNDSSIDIETLGSNGQISSFKVAATAMNAADSITYPSLKTTFFTIVSNNTYDIFNLDSLPPRIDLTRKLLVTIKYIGSPSSVELIYLDQNRVDSIVEWNTSDSVQFIIDNANGHDVYYPNFNVISANQLIKRRYFVDFRVHDVQPDSIIWERPKTSNSYFVLPQSGESKVICDADTTTFYALMQNESKSSFAISSINDPSWISYDLNLPTNLLVKSLILRDGTFSVLTTDGKVSQFSKYDLTKNSKSVNTSTIYRTIIGTLPNLPKSTANEILVTYYNSNGELLFGKTTDFVTVEPLKIADSNIDLITDNFPITSYAQTYKKIGNTTSIVLTGGKSISNTIIENSWFINNVSLATTNSLATVSILPGKSDVILPYASGISTFVYNDLIQAFSGDSLRLYTSLNGQHWKKDSEYNVLPKDMGSINRPSIIVDKNKYIWVLGGDTPLNTSGAFAHYRDIWRGRMNKMTFKPIAEQ